MSTAPAFEPCEPVPFTPIPPTPKGSTRAAVANAPTAMSSLGLLPHLSRRPVAVIDRLTAAATADGSLSAREFQ
jgi:hypothetical protein